MAKIVEVTNPVTGQPTQVDQLDHTAQQIDDGLNIARGVSNPNLLDNWYFGNPVDQRQGRVVVPNTTYYSDNTLATAAGTTSAYVTAYRYATGTANGVNYASFKLEDTDTAPTYYAAPENVVRGYTGTGYGIDMWASNGASVLITDDGVTIIGDSNGICQKIDNYKALSGQLVTISILAKSRSGVLVGSLISGSFRHNFTSDGLLLSETITLPELTAPLEYWMYMEGVGESTLKAAKLELGSQQTLAHQENGNWVPNEIPDYGEQLARCQRHLLDTRSGGSENAYSGVATETWLLATNVVFPEAMREVPGIKLYNNSTAGHVRRIDNNEDIALPSTVYISRTKHGMAFIYNPNHADTFIKGAAYDFNVVANAGL